jgi:molecular chaperone GrpE (heat shock protein)
MTDSAPSGVPARSGREEATSRLREKLITFQKQIATLQHALREKEESHRTSEKGLLLQLLDLADAFAAFDEAEQRKAPAVDPARQKLVRQVRGMQKKLDYILKEQQVVPLDLGNNQARMELCEVVSTEPHPELPDETIVSFLSRGYLHQKEGKVLRKAKVITVLNHPPEFRPGEPSRGR